MTNHVLRICRQCKGSARRAINKLLIQNVVRSQGPKANRLAWVIALHPGVGGRKWIQGAELKPCRFNNDGIIFIGCFGIKNDGGGHGQLTVVVFSVNSG